MAELRLTQKDKAQIIKDILIKKNLLERGLRIPEVRGVIYLKPVRNSGPLFIGVLSLDSDFVTLNFLRVW